MHRRVRQPSGGHLKFLDYLRHIRAHGTYFPRVYLADLPGLGAAQHQDNPFLAEPAHLIEQWHPRSADALLLGAMDWKHYPETFDSPDRPVLSLVQGLRVAEPGNPRRQFLRRPALRICVSQAVHEALLATGEVRGPMLTIPAGLNLPQRGALQRDARIFISALKQVELGERLAYHLRALGLACELLTDWLPRPQYLDRLATAAIAVLLPARSEGLFLPGLEAMALGTALVTVHAGGNGDYLRDGENALVRPGDEQALAAACVILQDPALRARLSATGRITANGYSLDTERAQVHRLLDDLPRLWRNCWPQMSPI